MVPFFGILTPASEPAHESDEAPYKRSFFGGDAIPPAEAVTPRCEAEALYLWGKMPEPPEERFDWFGSAATGLAR